MPDREIATILFKWVRRYPGETMIRFAVPALALLAIIHGCASGPSGTAYSGPISLPEIRSSQGLQPLRSDPGLETAAAEQAQLMAGKGSMRHTTGFGRSFGTRMRGVETNGGAAENIAHGRFGTDELFSRWMNSPGHRRNMLNPTFTRYGLASAPDPKQPGSRYWALVLAR